MRRRFLPALLALTALSLVAVGCGDEDADTADETTATSEDQSSTTSTDDAGAGSMAEATLAMKTEDGTIDLQFEKVVCTSADETTFTASGEVDGTTITAQAAGQVGNLVLMGTDEFSGTIRGVVIGDTGALAATGTGSTPDPNATATEFTIRGQCN